MNATSTGSSALVIDASVGIWAVLPVSSEYDVTKDVDVIGRMMIWRAQGKRVLAPKLWLVECTSAIRGTVYARAITDEEGQQALEDLFALEVETMPIDEQMCRQAIDWSKRLGRSKAYDGFYMALAESLGVGMWTADRQLKNAAQQIGGDWVHWIGEGL